MSWEPIETAPRAGPILVYFGMRDDPGFSEPGRVEAFRVESCYCIGGVIYEAWTGHRVFESWKKQNDLPTHWKRQEPPEDK